MVMIVNTNQTDEAKWILSTSLPNILGTNAIDYSAISEFIYYRGRALLSTFDTHESPLPVKINLEGFFSVIGIDTVLEKDDFSEHSYLGLKLSAVDTLSRIGLNKTALNELNIEEKELTNGVLTVIFEHPFPQEIDLEPFGLFKAEDVLVLCDEYAILDAEELITEHIIRDIPKLSFDSFLPPTVSDLKLTTPDTLPSKIKWIDHSTLLKILKGCDTRGSYLPYICYDGWAKAGINLPSTKQLFDDQIYISGQLILLGVEDIYYDTELKTFIELAIDPRYSRSGITSDVSLILNDQGVNENSINYFVEVPSKIKKSFDLNNYKIYPEAAIYDFCKSNGILNAEINIQNSVLDSIPPLSFELLGEPSQSLAMDRPLQQSERLTFLQLFNVLLLETNISVDHPYKAEVIIQQLAATHGAICPQGKGTIAKKIEEIQGIRKENALLLKSTKKPN